MYYFECQDGNYIYPSTCWALDRATVEISFTAETPAYDYVIPVPGNVINLRKVKVCERSEGRNSAASDTFFRPIPSMGFILICGIRFPSRNLPQNLMLSIRCFCIQKRPKPQWLRAFGDPSGTRTRDTLIKSQVLYRLS